MTGGLGKGGCRRGIDLHAWGSRRKEGERAGRGEQAWEAGVGCVKVRASSEKGKREQRGARKENPEV